MCHHGNLIAVVWHVGWIIRLLIELGTVGIASKVGLGIAVDGQTIVLVIAPIVGLCNNDIASAKSP